MPEQGSVHHVLNAVVALAVVIWPGLVRARDGAGGDDPLFREKVAPILERRCIHCHGESTHKGNLSLSTAESALRGGDSGPAVLPGKPDDSALFDKITGDPPEMPQKDKPLSKPEVDSIRGWIERGAVWPAGLALKDRRFEGARWWAFEPLVRPPVPPVSRSRWARTPIDAFVLATLAQERLTPSPEADRRTLIRRLSFDLIGLPPTPDEIESFVRDADPNAYEALVDRLLASPHYGERWGRHWLDIVHYGDTHGYDKDKRRDHAWPYRDYVIGAFNADLPFGQFVREQVAGDALQPAQGRGAVATAFIAAGPWDFVGHVELREGTLDKLKTRLLDRDDMVSSTMSTFVSMTVHCARCHDHKFDPITQTDYYRLQAVFAGVDRGDRPYQSALQTERRLRLGERRDLIARRSRSVSDQIAAVTSPAVAELDQQLKAMRQQLRDTPKTISGPESPTNGYHSAIHPQPESTAWVQVDLGSVVPIDEIRLISARPTDFPDTPGFGFPPRFHVEVSDDPTFIRADRVAVGVRPDHVSFEDETYVIRPPGRAARFVRVTATRLWKRVDDFVFALGELEVISRGLNRARGAKVTALESIEGGRWARANLVDGFDSRHACPAETDPVAGFRHDLVYRLGQVEERRAHLAEALVDSALRSERDVSSVELASIDQQIQALDKESMVYGIQSHSPRSVAVLRRGEVDQPGAPVGPGALECLPGLPGTFALAQPGDEASRRVALADWLASTGNMLTWRSIANRLWHYHFGRGIVETPNDFGRNGARPTHPEMLDWMALEVRDRGQSLKSLHRLIVTSAVYRQTSGDNPAFDAIDADNRYFWRQNRRRLDAEAIRDSVLAVAGTLESRMGGPGFELFYFKDDHSPTYDHTDPAKVDNPLVRRRTVYRFNVRSVPNPFLEALDCADPNLNTPVRSQTLTALQALALWNDLFMVRQGREFARRLEETIPDARARIVAAYWLALGRAPTDPEREAMTNFAARHGLAHACRVLCNTNEFVFVD